MADCCIDGAAAVPTAPPHAYPPRELKRKHAAEADVPTAGTEATPVGAPPTEPRVGADMVGVAKPALGAPPIEEAV
jgi:hypothetical protein